MANSNDASNESNEASAPARDGASPRRVLWTRAGLALALLLVVGGALAAVLVLGLNREDAEQEPAPVSEPGQFELPSSAPTGAVGGAVGDTAPEFAGISNWLNSAPLVMEELRGQVVLIDFWTYTCVNCIRTLPYLVEWHEKYADEGLTMVGVHTPEFEFEKLTENVVKASEDLGVEWAVAQDNDFRTWRAYGNRYWPAKYLIDADGVVRYTHFGEGAYDETEAHIRTLLTEAGADVSGIAANPDPGPQADARAYGTSVEDQQTREIYGGWDRNALGGGLYIAHQQYYEGQGLVQTYRDPGVHLNQFMYLNGSWRAGAESIQHGRATENYEDYIALKFFARTVNAVFDLEDGVEPFDVQVTLNGRPLLAEEAGGDVVVESGRSYFVVDEARLYSVVALPEFGDAELTLSSNSPDFALFAFTFGSYENVF